MFPQYERRDSSLFINLGQAANAYPARFHKELEIAYVEEGELKVRIDNVPYVLKKGDLYLAFPNTLHAGERNEGCRISIVIADCEYCAAYSEALTRSKPLQPVLRKGSFNKVVYTIFQRMYQVDRSNLPYKQSALIGYLNALLGELFVPLELVRRESDNDLVQQLVLYFLDNYTGEITLDDVAKSLNYSKYYISHVISETFGCNFRPLINSYRIRMAQNLLLSTNKSIGEIAYECGFNNQSSFNRIFLKHTGSTPSAFRRQQDTVPDIPSLVIR